jgi:hypothetical protein
MAGPSLWLVQYRRFRRGLETARAFATAEGAIVKAMQVLWWAMPDDEHEALRCEGAALDTIQSASEQNLALRAALREVVECERAKACFEGLPFDAYRALLAQPVPT